MKNKTYRPEHNFARECVLKNAVKVLKGLHEAGFEVYLVGGSVRDILLGRNPKDFDIATAARPEEVRKVFKNCRLIGRRFRLAHIFFGREIIEVATFRSNDRSNEQDDDLDHNKNRHGMIARDNAYGSLDDDAVRRDFSINALYYDWFDDCVLNFHDGLADLKARKLRLIGQPAARYREDPVRILRAIRFATKLDFTIEKKTAQQISEMAPLLSHVSPARLFEEFIKMFQAGFAHQAFCNLEHYQLLRYFLPQICQSLQQENAEAVRKLIVTALKDTDERVRKNMRTTPAYLIAVFLWDAVKQEAKDNASEQGVVFDLQQAAMGVFAAQKQIMIIPKALKYMAKDIWEMQPLMTKTKGKKPLRMLQHKKFRAAYDFLCLRYRAGEVDLAAQVDWWTTFQFASHSKQKKMAGIVG